MKSILSLAVFAVVFWYTKDHAAAIITSMNQSPELYTALGITICLKPILGRFID